VESLFLLSFLLIGHHLGDELVDMTLRSACSVSPRLRGFPVSSGICSVILDNASD